MNEKGQRTLHSGRLAGIEGPDNHICIRGGLHAGYRHKSSQDCERR